MDWIQKAIAAVCECEFPDMELSVKKSSATGSVYLQGEYLEADTVTGKMETQYTRRWVLSPAMSKSEIVSTAFKCVLTSMEHRVREWFLYKGRAIYQPHYDVDALHAICLERQERPLTLSAEAQKAYDESQF